MNIEDLKKAISEFKPKNMADIESFRLEFLGKKGHLQTLFSTMKTLAPEMRKSFGKDVNELKVMAESRLHEWKASFENSSEESIEKTDLSLPGDPLSIGARHPISLIRNKIINIFSRIGYDVSDGPEIEDDWHNFSALNFPPDHPARDMQDTFFLKQNKDFALRTHTSSVQVRVMSDKKPPIRTISPGRVYRNEAISARAHCFFHQVEGLYIDEGVSFADMKQTLLYFARQMFGKDVKIRLRPSYFPFTEPSAEMDVYWGLETESDHRITKSTGWLEVLGCGMVDPNVLKNLQIDDSVFSGFAFGIGIERIAMLKYHVKDLRIFSENDLRFLKQFEGISTEF